MNKYFRSDPKQRSVKCVGGEISENCERVQALFTMECFTEQKNDVWCVEKPSHDRVKPDIGRNEAISNSEFLMCKSGGVSEIYSMRFSEENKKSCVIFRR